MKVLFTNSLTYGAYSNIKRLARSHPSYVMDACGFKITSLDLNLTNLLNPYAPAYETHQYISQLITYVKKFGIDLIVPLGEEHKYIAMHREKILAAAPHGCQIICPKNFASFDLFDDKKLFHRFIDELAVPRVRVPRITPLAELDLERKYIVKTRLGKAGFNTYQIDYGRVIREQDIEPHSFIQEYIEAGRELCVAGISYAGQTEFIVYQSEIGVNYRYTRDREVEAALEAAIPLILSRSGYEGYFGFDFIEKDGSFYFLECNTRSTLGSIGLTLELRNQEVVLSKNSYDHLVAPMLGVYSDSVLKSLLSLGQGFKLFDLKYSFIAPLVFSLYYKFASPGLSKVLAFGFVRSRQHYEYFSGSIPKAILEELDLVEQSKYAGFKEGDGRAAEQESQVVYILVNKKIFRISRSQKSYKDSRSSLEASLEASYGQILTREDMTNIAHILNEKHPSAEWIIGGAADG